MANGNQNGGVASSCADKAFNSFEIRSEFSNNTLKNSKISCPVHFQKKNGFWIYAALNWATKYLQVTMIHYWIVDLLLEYNDSVLKCYDARARKPQVFINIFQEYPYP